MIVMLPSGFLNMPFQLDKDLIKGFDHGKINLNAFAYLSIFEPFYDALVVVFTPQLLFECGKLTGNWYFEYGQPVHCNAGKCTCDV
jgi:hypothetical protein